MFHGSIFSCWEDDKLEFSMLEDEEADEPWLPLSAFENVCGLLKITGFLLTNECAWKYTTNHHEELLLDF